MHHLHAVNTDIKAGVVASTQATRDRYWRHWCNFLPPNIHPHLQELDAPQRLVVLQIFARRVREGAYGRGKQVKTGSVQTALGAVAKTIELAGYSNPLYKPGTTNYLAALALQTETYKREDPATQKQLAVPVTIPNHIFLATRTTADKRLRAVGELTIMAFFFLLRVGEYTHHGKGIRRTQQFRLKDVKCFAAGQEISTAQIPQHRAQINLISLTIDNQKNGKRGETLSHHALTDGNPCCPVRAVVARITDMLRYGATPDTLLCAFREANSLPWQYVRSSDMVAVVKQAVTATGTQLLGYTPDQVGSHSLRAGGAMALFINKHDAIEIQRAGRWTSTTFMEYIHGQLDVVSIGLSTSMAKITPFLNMARTTVTPG